MARTVTGMPWHFNGIRCRSGNGTHRNTQRYKILPRYQSGNGSNARNAGKHIHEE